MDYKNLKEKELIKLCQERKIRFIPSLSKQEMIEILQMNDEDQTGNSLIHPDVEIRRCCNKLSRYAKFITVNQSSMDRLYFSSQTKINLKEKKLYEKLLPNLDVVVVSQKKDFEI